MFTQSERDLLTVSRALLNLNGFFLVTEENTILDNPIILVDLLTKMEIETFKTLLKVSPSDRVEIEENIVENKFLALLGSTYKINFNFTDLAQQYTVSVENSVLNYSQHVHPKADAQVILTKDTFNQLQLGTVTWQEKIKSGDIKIVGNAEVLTQLKLMIDEYNFWFNIVTP